MSRDLSVNLCGVTLKNPVIAASGTFGYGKEYSVYISLRELGGIPSRLLQLHHGKEIRHRALLRPLRAI